MKIPTLGARVRLTQLTQQQEVVPVVGMEGYLDIIELWRQGQSISEISRRTGHDRKTVRRLVEHGPPAPRMPRKVTSKLDPFREYLITRLIEDKVSNAAVLYDEIRARGYEGGRSILWDFLRPLRSVLEERVTVRFETPPGKQAQADWGDFKKPAMRRVNGFTFTLGFSRASYLEFTDTQALAALLLCHERAFHFLGGVPEEVLYDRMKTVWLRDDHRGDPVFHPGLLDFAAHYGYRPRLCRPRRPQTKGKVENGVGYVRKNFWPRVVSYGRAADLMPEALHWLGTTANARVHGTTGERPMDRLPLEHLRSLDGVPLYRALVLERRRVDRDSYVSYASNWYSVPAEHASREVWVRQTEDRVIVSYGDQVLADHALSLGRRQRITDPRHFTRLAERRDARLEREVADALSRVLLPAGIEGPDVEKRPLSIYEELL